MILSKICGQRPVVRRNCLGSSRRLGIRELTAKNGRGNCPTTLSSGNEGLIRAYNCFVMIAKELLEILVCPVCKKPLVQKDNGESLKCAECRRVYPVRDEIPILLVDEATTDPA